MKYKFVDEGKTHVHTIDGDELTGVSSVLKVLSKPLTYWAAGLALEPFGWINPKKFTPEEVKAAAKRGLETVDGFTKGITPEDNEAFLTEYVKFLNDAYHAHATSLKDSAETGTDLHALVEEYVKLMISDQDGIPHDINQKDNPIQPFINWAVKNVKKFLWSELYCYSETHWLGGISDIGAEMKDGGVAVIDIKSSKEAYPSQFFQAAGYDILISENGGYTKDGEKIFTLEKPITEHIIFPFGAKEPTGFVRFDVDNNKKAFLNCLEILRSLQKYN